MKKIIIPRKDHEVYFIRVPEDMKPKLVQSFAAEQLEKLHPVFSGTSAYDLQRFTFGKSRWIMATVMEGETFAEYRILHRGAAFFTNTSIAVHKKEFINSGIAIVDDEQIGFDSEKGEPVSVPMEAENLEHAEGQPFFKAKLKNIPSGHGVFPKRKPQRRIAAMTTGILLMVLASSIFVLAAKGSGDVRLPDEIAIPAEEIRYFPAAIEILEKFSIDVVNSDGKMLRWQYNEDSDPFIEIQIRGMDVLTIHEICDQYEYAVLEDIQDVNYSDGEPFVTINLNAARAGYTIIKAGAFSLQSSTLPMIADLSNFLRQQEIIIVSEALPTSDNGNIFYTIIYTAKDWNLIRSLEIITETCDKYLLQVKKMDISISNGNNQFTVVCSLSRCYLPDRTITVMGKERGMIPLAFGYKDLPLLPAVPRQTKMPEPESEPRIVGSIRDGNGQMLFYRDTEAGKIKVWGEGK
jgi:hypothetical protein